jgi:YHS domain-containing protein
MLLGVALMSGAMIVGCESRESTTPATPAPSTESPAEGTESPTTAPASAPATQASASLTIANKYCAVQSVHEIDPKVTVASNGKTIGFCCKDCIETFEKDPAKYLATLK